MRVGKGCLAINDHVFAQDLQHWHKATIRGRRKQRSRVGPSFFHVYTYITSTDDLVLSIIFVHGLTGDREETWKTNGASAPWPETLLPSKVSNARVLTFGYDAYVADWRGMVSKNRIGNHSMNMLTTIATHREDDETVCPGVSISLEMTDCTRTTGRSYSCATV